MSDTEKILEAISQGPLPLHVLRRKTGLNHGLEVALQPMISAGTIVRQGGMVALPVPSYTDTVHEIDDEVEELKAELREGDDHTEEWHEPLQGDEIPLPSEDVTRVMAPIEPIDPDNPPQTYLVAIEWAQVEAVDAQAAAEAALGEERSAALVILADEATVFERALVTRRRA